MLKQKLIIAINEQLKEGESPRSRNNVITYDPEGQDYLDIEWKDPETGQTVLARINVTIMD